MPIELNTFQNEQNPKIIFRNGITEKYLNCFFSPDDDQRLKLVENNLKRILLIYLILFIHLFISLSIYIYMNSLFTIHIQ